MARFRRTWLIGFSALFVLGVLGCASSPDDKAEAQTMDAEEVWCEEQRAIVTAYLKSEKVDHGAVGEWPAWHIMPRVSIFAIQSKKAPGRVGWWVIAGDLPTDYVSAATIKHPRDAARALAERWSKLADEMAQGRAHEDIKIGERKDWPETIPLLRSRSKMLLDWVADDTFWPE